MNKKLKKKILQSTAFSLFLVGSGSIYAGCTASQLEQEAEKW